MLGIKSKREMDGIEAQEQLRVLEELSRIYAIDHKFTVADISGIHRIWLGKVYEWAGQYRRVNLSKDGFLFAPSNQIPRLMDDFENDVLKKYTPCRSSSIKDIAGAIAVVHTELVLIHPFREGNGRVARILSAIMALQAGLPSLDFSGVRGKQRKEYFAAVRAGMDRKYELWRRFFTP